MKSFSKFLNEAGLTIRKPEGKLERIVDVDPNQAFFIPADIQKFLQFKLPIGLWRDFLFWVQHDGILDTSEKLDKIAKKLKLHFYQVINGLKDPNLRPKIEKLYQELGGDPQEVVLTSSGMGSGRPQMYYVPIEGINWLDFVHDINTRGETKTAHGPIKDDPSSNLQGIYTGDVGSYYDSAKQVHMRFGGGYNPINYHKPIQDMIDKWIKNSQNTLLSKIPGNHVEPENYTDMLGDEPLPNYIKFHELQPTTIKKKKYLGNSGNFSGIKVIKPEHVNKPIDINDEIAKGWHWQEERENVEDATPIDIKKLQEEGWTWKTGSEEKGEGVLVKKADPLKKYVRKNPNSGDLEEYTKSGFEKINVKKLIEKEGWHWEDSEPTNYGDEGVLLKDQESTESKKVRKTEDGWEEYSKSRERLAGKEPETDNGTLVKGGVRKVVKRNENGEWMELAELNPDSFEPLKKDSGNYISQDTINPMLLPAGKEGIGGLRPNTGAQEQYPGNLKEDFQELYNILEELLAEKDEEGNQGFKQYFQNLYKSSIPYEQRRNLTPEDRKASYQAFKTDMLTGLFKFARHQSFHGDKEAKKEFIKNKIQSLGMQLRHSGNKEKQSATVKGKSGEELDIWANVADPSEKDRTGPQAVRGMTSDEADTSAHVNIQRHHTLHSPIRENAYKIALYYWTNALIRNPKIKSDYLIEDPPAFTDKEEAKTWLQNPKNFDLDQVVEDQLSNRNHKFGLNARLFNKIKLASQDDKSLNVFEPSLFADTLPKRSIFNLIKIGKIDKNEAINLYNASKNLLEQKDFTPVAKILYPKFMDKKSENSTPGIHYGQIYYSALVDYVADKIANHDASTIKNYKNIFKTLQLFKDKSEATVEWYPLIRNALSKAIETQPVSYWNILFKSKPKTAVPSVGVVPLPDKPKAVPARTSVPNPEPEEQPVLQQTAPQQTFWSSDDLENDENDQPPPRRHQQRNDDWYESFKDYFKMRETYAVFDPKKAKPKKDSGFNWWGAVGNLSGTFVSKDPVKQKKLF